MTLIATCHCGATRIELPALPAEVKECNCTYCHRTGAVWGYYRPEDVRVVSAEHDAIYSASGPVNEHHFCAHCGGNTYGSSPDWASMYNNDGTLKEGMTEGMPTTRIFAINLRMVEDLDLATLDVVKVDGRNSW
ncbi:aldehyde-activating protein [Devosia geojensis]|uniref:Aldehyde-activating protein n=1 Tax=Devosia geojensis TaxID=443610 RepID=A0A0F5FYB2_9HYPH|nr:GFA family protein [Devosia geojensis]KKB13535.1 aldehyde-activating protein [Devosia geojensis]